MTKSNASYKKNINKTLKSIFKKGDVTMLYFIKQLYSAFSTKQDEADKMMIKQHIDELKAMQQGR